MPEPVRFSGWRGAWGRFFGRGAYPHQLAFLLLVPLRGLLLSPRGLCERLRLERGSRVLELGPGPGYFSVEVARRVPQGRLVLLDLQREMLTKARRRLRRAAAANVDYAQADATALPLRAGSIDRAFLVTVLGEVSDPPACVAEIARVLRPGGLLVVVELPGDPDALTAEQVRAFAQRAGLEPFESTRLPGGFSATFERPDAAR
jgi:ubiquinone/menaquinone biosynthesis C-methylase UbiE